MELRLAVHNRHEKKVDLWIEPWGDILTLHPGATLFVVGIGPAGQGFEVEFRDDGYAIFGWSGSVISIFDTDGKEVWSCSIPAP